MKPVGFVGGGNISAIGTALEVESLFQLIVDIAEDGERGSRFPLITETLYQGSISPAQFEALKAEWTEVFELLSKVRTADVDWQAYRFSGHDRPRIDLGRADVGAVFSGVREALLMTIEMAQFEASHGEDPRIRVGFTSVPDYMAVESRSDSAHDTLTGPPIWMG